MKLSFLFYFVHGRGPGQMGEVNRHEKQQSEEVQPHEEEKDWVEEGHEMKVEEKEKKLEETKTHGS